MIPVAMNTPDHNLLDILPNQFGAILMTNGHSDPSLNTLMKQEFATARRVVAVIHGDGNVLATGLELTDLEPYEDVVLGANMGGAHVLPVLDGLRGYGFGHLRRVEVLEGRFLLVVILEDSVDVNGLTV